MKHRTAEAPDALYNPWLVIGDVLIGERPYKLYNGQITTYNELQRELRDTDVVKQYRRLTNDDRTQINWSRARDVVMGYTTMEWYRARGEAVPAQVAARHEERMAKAKTAAPEAAAEQGNGQKAQRVTSKSIIESGLLAGDSTEKILAAVKRQFPDRKTDDKHVGYYRHFMEKKGQIEKRVKEPTTPKVKAEKVKAPASATTAAGKKSGSKAKAGR